MAKFCFESSLNSNRKLPLALRSRFSSAVHQLSPHRSFGSPIVLAAVRAAADCDCLQRAAQPSSGLLRYAEQHSKLHQQSSTGANSHHRNRRGALLVANAGGGGGLAKRAPKKRRRGGGEEVSCLSTSRVLDGTGAQTGSISRRGHNILNNSTWCGLATCRITPNLVLTRWWCTGRHLGQESPGWHRVRLLGADPVPADSEHLLPGQCHLESLPASFAVAE